MTTPNEIIEIIGRNPGASGVTIHIELVKRSRCAKWFGEHSFWTALFGPSIGGMYVWLMNLEERGALRSEWGDPVCPGGPRRRHYYLTEG